MTCNAAVVAAAALLSAVPLSNPSIISLTDLAVDVFCLLRLIAAVFVLVVVVLVLVLDGVEAYSCEVKLVDIEVVDA